MWEWPPSYENRYLLRGKAFWWIWRENAHNDWWRWPFRDFQCEFTQPFLSKSWSEPDPVQWIRKTLTAEEGLIEDVKSPSLSFTKKDFLRTVSSLWQSDHPRFMPGLLKVTILLTLQLYLFTGARIGAFVPAHEDKKERGLRYKVSRVSRYDDANLADHFAAYWTSFVSIINRSMEGRVEGESSMVEEQSKCQIHSVSRTSAS